MNPTAVSVSPSLPPIVWKKNSVADNPLKKELATKPLACIKSNNSFKCRKQRRTVMHNGGNSQKQKFTTIKTIEVTHCCYM